VLELPAEPEQLMTQSSSSSSSSSVRRRLRAVARQKRGDAWQLVACWVALLRALGVHARTVWVLEAPPRRIEVAEAMQGPVVAVSLAKLREASGGGGGGRGRPAAAAAAAAAALKRSGGSSSSGKRRRDDEDDDKVVILDDDDDDDDNKSDGGKKKNNTAKAPPKKKKAAKKSGDEDDEDDEAQQQQKQTDPETEREMRLAMARSLLETRPRSGGEHEQGGPSTSSPPRPRPVRGAGTAWVRGGNGNNTDEDAFPKNAIDYQRALDTYTSFPHERRAAATAAATMPVCWSEVFLAGTPPSSTAAATSSSSSSTSHFTGRWLHVDPLNNWVDAPRRVEDATARGRGRELAYVVAYDHHAAPPAAPRARRALASARDVTRRYSRDFRQAQRSYREEGWWVATLSTSTTSPTMAAAAAGAGAGAAAAPPGRSQQQQPSSRHHHRNNRPAAAAAATAAAAAEDAEFEAARQRERAAVPTSIQGFRGHPAFVLHRHVKQRYEAIRPGSTPAGVYKGESYWRRADVQPVHAEDKWRRLGRQVKASEWGDPAKIVPKRGQSAAGAASGDEGGGGGGGNNRRRGGRSRDEDEDDELAGFTGGGGAGGGASSGGGAAGADDSTTPAPGQAVVHLYGEWQTEPYELPAAQNGRVPKNDRGNVEAPPLAKVLPRGTVHLLLPGLGPICKKLGVDFAPALTGFDRHGGRMVPRIEGVVVCEEHEDAVLAAAAEAGDARRREAQRKRREEGRRLWLRLVRALQTRVELERRYGAAGAGEGGQEEEEEEASGGGAGGGRQQQQQQQQQQGGRGALRAVQAATAAAGGGAAAAKARSSPAGAAPVQQQDEEMEEEAGGGALPRSGESGEEGGAAAAADGAERF
jgi:xeroderma pigmentosum group C-complementing protein